MDNYKEGILGYQEMVIRVSAGIEKMETLCSGMGLEQRETELKAIREKLAKHTFTVGIMGEFKRGKSTVINSLLEKEIVPSDVLPCSATMNRITYGMSPQAKIVMKNGTVEEIKIERLAEYVTKLDDTCEATAAEVEEAIVCYPCKFCENGVDIIDTPGFNDDERMDKVTEEVIPKLDAVVMVLASRSPFGMSEADFVRNKMMASDLGKIIFLVNKMDLVEKEADRQKILDAIKENVRVSVLDKMETIYGKDSEEYRKTEAKLGSIKVYPFSARDALEGKMEGNRELVQKSGTAAFEKALTHLLTEERGAVELFGPLSLLMGMAVEIESLINTRKISLEIDLQEYEKDKNEALEKIKESRTQKKKELQRLRAESAELKVQMNVLLQDFYGRLMKEIDAVIDNFDIKSFDLSQKAEKEKAVNEITDKILEKIMQSAENFTELVQKRIQDRVGDEVVQLGQFTADMSGRLKEKIPGYDRQAVEQMERKDYMIQVGAELVTDLINLYGVGGIIAGWSAAGMRGAVVGGVTAFAVTQIACSLAVSVACPAIPALMIAAAVGTSAGKGVVKKIFLKDVQEREAAHLKESVRQNAQEYVKNQMKGSHVFEDWINNIIETQFRQLIKIFEEKCDKILEETEQTMDEIKRDLVLDKASRQQKKEELEGLLISVGKLREELMPIFERIQSVLKEDAYA